MALMLDIFDDEMVMEMMEIEGIELRRWLEKEQGHQQKV